MSAAATDLPHACRHCGHTITARTGVGGTLWSDGSAFAGAVFFKARALVHEPSNPPASGDPR